MAVRDRGTTTVAFELGALERAANPEAVFVQTNGWARSVGIVSDRDTPVQTNRAREWGIDYSFTSGPRDLLDSLVRIRQQPEHEADRYLLIATADVPAAAVRDRGWDYLELEEAADAAGWTLRPRPDDRQDDADEDRGWP